mgnify:CR=1 FL=1
MITNSSTASHYVTVEITPNDKGNPPGKLADAELHFGTGVLEGFNLIRPTRSEACRSGRVRRWSRSRAVKPFMWRRRRRLRR